MTFQIDRSEKSRHLVLRAGNGASLPDALTAALRAERVSCGWLRGAGVVSNAALRAFDGERGALGPLRTIAGPIQVVSLEGGIGVVDGSPSISLRAVLARETDRGLETLAGELESARTVGLEIIVTAFDDVALGRALDPNAGVRLFTSQANPLDIGAMAAATKGTPSAGGWSAALEASTDGDRPPANRPGGALSSGSAQAVMPPRPVRREEDTDSPVPEAGDVVEHFAFGRCDVVKSDGDRLHLRAGKEGRIREIALEMLRVTRLDDAAGKHHYKLERRM